ncbi:MAG: DNA replication/repair protein RecF [Candidatus Margulisiibacteriota bacterium]
MTPFPHIKKLWIKGFRNIGEILLDLTAHRHCFVYGNNNQGKTNFLEAIYVLANGVSPKEAHLDYLVGFGKEAAYVGADVSNGDQDERLYLKLTADKKKSLFLNQKPIRSFQTLRSLWSVQYLSADVIQLFQDQPDGRRQDLNRFCSLYFKGYPSVLKNFERALKQRNSALKAQNKAEATLWNEPFITYALEIIRFRQEACTVLEGILKQLMLEGQFPFQVLSVRYWTANRDSFLDYRQWLVDKLTQNMHKELRAGYTLYGPHRDDFEIMVDGHSLYHFFSRGINRSFAILLKVAQLMALQNQYGGFPILLLDDVFAELDPNMKAIMVNVIQHKTAVFYTSVIPEDGLFFEDVKGFEMVQGQLN